MLTLQGKIKEFIRMNPPPQEWKENLNQVLSLPDDVRSGMPLVIIFDVGKDEKRPVFTLKASDVCSEGNLFKRFHESLKGLVMNRTPQDIPESWTLEYPIPIIPVEKGPLVGASG